MIKHISDRVGVMYLGSLVEFTISDALYKNPLHPYTQALLSAIPIADPNLEKEKRRILIEGEIPSPINPAPGCKFASRCKYVMDICKKEMPPLIEVEKEHFVACHMVNKS
jgi:oligopeptide transport system ATP-binding protein